MQECKKCGTCCEKNGPTLHIEDKYLVESGKIPPTDLVTLRKGEAAFDPVSGKKIYLEEEIIKIKGTGESWQCRYYDEKDKLCLIYNTRPLECRLLKCWDPKPLISVINKNILSRENLFKKIDGLYDLIKDHEDKCSYANIKTLLEALEKNESKNSVEKLKDIILFDKNIRDVVSEKQPAAGKMSELIFGRPVSETIKQFKFKVKFTDNGLIISPSNVDKIMERSIS